MAGAKLSHNSYGPARVWTPMQTRSKAAAAAKNAAAATPSPSRRAVISIDEGDKDFMSSDDANSDEDGGSDLGGETDEYDDDGDIGLGDDDDDRDLHGTGWMSEEMQTLIWDNVAYCLQREVPVSIASSSHEKLQVEFSDLPTAARTLYNWPSSCMVFRLTFGAGLMKHHTHPTVSIQTPDGRHWLGGAALGTAHAAHAESGVYHLKALLSLIALDLEVLWPMHSATDVHQRVLTRISATADAAQEKVFQVDEALCQINVESSVQEIIKHTQSVANATGGNKSCRLGRLVESMWHNVMQLRSRCFVCGAPHPAASVVHHPQACVKALCRFNYTVDCMRYGELLPAIRQRPQVVDLLMTLAVTACESSRKASIFTPAPVDFISGQCQKKAAGGLVTVDYLKLADHMRIFPPVAKMLECENEGELLRRLSHTYPWKSCDIALSCKEQEALAKAAEREITEGDVALGHRLYRLLWWIITNIVDSIDYVEYSRLPAAVTCAIGTTPRPSGANGYNANNESKSPASRLVFKTTSLCAVLSTAFRKHADKHGVFQVYHGSSLENWYSILKHGLRNMSGSGYQVNGASYGSGIYLGKDWKTSKGYAGQRACQVPVSYDMKDGWAPTFLTTTCSMVAVCSVAKTPQVTGGADKGYCWVVPDPEHVSLQYLVVDNTS